MLRCPLAITYGWLCVAQIWKPVEATICVGEESITESGPDTAPTGTTTVTVFGPASVVGRPLATPAK